MDNLTDLNNHFYGSASKGFLAVKSKIGDFMHPICRKDKKRIRKKLEKIMMLQNLSDSPPRPIIKIAGMDIGFGRFNKNGKRIKE